MRIAFALPGREAGGNEGISLTLSDLCDFFCAGILAAKSGKTVSKRLK